MKPAAATIGAPWFLFMAMGNVPLFESLKPLFLTAALDFLALAVFERRDLKS